MWIKNWWATIYKNRYKILFSLFIALLANVFNTWAGTYVTNLESAKYIPDAILDNVRPVDLSFIFVWFIIFVTVIFYLYPLIRTPQRFHYFVNMGSLFMFIRAIFITLTHLQAPFDAVPITWPGGVELLAFTNDMFFSGHTGFPFLGFLLFNGFLKYFMLLSSFILGATSLFVHQHYSIDVFAAFFITYGIYKIGNWIFDKFSITKYSAKTFKGK